MYNESYDSYIKALNAEDGIDGEIIIATSKGDFKVGEIMSMSKKQHKKLNFKDKFNWRIIEFLFNHSVRKLSIRKEIIANHRVAINKILKSNFQGNDVVYVSNYDDAGNGPSVWNVNWDGSHSICVGHFEYASIYYSNMEEKDGYYFVKDNNRMDRIFTFDKKGYDYLMFGNLNHEQRIAVELIDFIDESFETMKIKTRYDLSALFQSALEGKFGVVDFLTTSSAQTDNAEAMIHTKKGVFICCAYFNGFERKDVMQTLLTKNSVNPLPLAMGI